MAAGEMKVLLEIGVFDVDGHVERTIIQMHICVEKCDLERDAK